MGVPTSEVGHTSATTGRGDHEAYKGHVVALDKKKLSVNIILTNPVCVCYTDYVMWFWLFPVSTKTLKSVQCYTEAKWCSNCGTVFSHRVKTAGKWGALFFFQIKSTPHVCHEAYCSGDTNQTPSYVALQLSSLSACPPPPSPPSTIICLAGLLIP
jgi:hypothetical protein